MRAFLALASVVLLGVATGCGSAGAQSQSVARPKAGSTSPASGLSAIPAGTADCGNGRSAPAYAVSGDGFKPETYTTDTVTPKGKYLGAVTSVEGRVSMTVNTCDGAGAYTVKLIDTEHPGNVVAASVSWTR
jgi:hypothetical protein